MKNEIQKRLLEVANFAFENGEILNAYTLLRSAPILVREEVLKSDIYHRIKQRIDIISNFQHNIRHGAGFADPPNTDEVVVYKQLLKHLEGKGVRRLVDVGCFSGWVGRNLSRENIQVLGIDLDPETVYMASRMATGTIASYEVLEGTRVGQKYPRKFDGAIMFDVVEHVFDPYVFMKSVENAVHDGGWIFINLPAYDEKRDVVTHTTPDSIKEHLRSWNDEEVDRDFKGAQVEKIINEDGRSSYFIVYEVRREYNSI